MTSGILDRNLKLVLDELDNQHAQRFEFDYLKAFLNEERVSELGARLGASADLIQRYATQGLGVDEADAIACRLGVNPVTIWPHWAHIKLIPDHWLDAAEEFKRTHKRCKRCNEWVPNEDFYFKASSPDSLSIWCKPCTRDYNRDKRTRRKRDVVAHVRDS